MSIESAEGDCSDALAKDYDVIWLQPRCCVDERAWCDSDPGPCEDCGLPSIKYVRAK